MVDAISRSELLRLIKQNATELQNVKEVIYVNTPFYLTWQFAVAVVLLLAVIVISGYAYFRITLRNRLVVIIHMPDRTRQFKSFKNFSGNKFTLDTLEIDKDGQPKKFTYIFRNEALELGYFGRYIEYDYLDSEPRIYKKSKFTLDYEFISAMLNTDLAVDLLLSSKFKELVKMLLVAILIISIIVLIGVIYIAYNQSTAPSMSSCSLQLTNETINTWKTLQQIK